MKSSEFVSTLESCNSYNL